MKPKVADQCDLCKGTLIQRKDDNLEALTVRLDAYEKQTFPLVAFYQKQRLLTKFDGSLKTQLLFDKHVRPFLVQQSKS
jgi:adenylate kinase